MPPQLKRPFDEQSRTDIDAVGQRAESVNSETILSETISAKLEYRRLSFQIRERERAVLNLRV